MTGWAHVRRETIPISDLRLDPLNPRLPEELNEAPQGEILAFLDEHEVLDELAQSFVDNGYFEHEPLIVIPAKSDDGFLVVEGNRRLATLLILLETPVADGVEPGFDLEVPGALRGELLAVPCYIVDSRDEVHRFLGFRHIGGPRRWSPEAKARYLRDAVRRAVRDGSDQPFRAVGRQVGSNALGVRNPYIAIRILEHAKEEFGLDSRFVQHQRFGVWNRCMNSRDLREYIGLGSPKTYEEVEGSLRELDHQSLEEVVGDLTRQNGEPPVLADSRDVTTYARVLTNEKARITLRRTRDLSLAQQVVEQAALPVRLRNLARTVEVLLGEVPRYEIDQEVVDAANELLGQAESLAAVAEAKARRNG